MFCSVMRCTADDDEMCESIHSPILTYLGSSFSTTTTGVSHVTDFTAVSMRPTRPPMAWKKSSSGVSPEMKEFSTKPRAPGESSYFVKCGSVRFSNP